MSALRRFFLRLYNFLRPGRTESDLAREVTQAYAGVLVVALPLVTLAALVPALRAARVDPMTALREP